MTPQIVATPGEIKSQETSALLAVASVWPGSSERRIRAPILRLEDHTSKVLACEFHPSGRLFLSSGCDGRIRKFLLL